MRNAPFPNEKLNDKDYVGCGLEAGRAGRTANMNPHDALAEMDNRAPVPLQPMMAWHQKQNMMDHLVAIEEINTGVAAEDWPKTGRRLQRVVTADAHDVRAHGQRRRRIHRAGARVSLTCRYDRRGGKGEGFDRGHTGDGAYVGCGLEAGRAADLAGARRRRMRRSPGPGLHERLRIFNRHPDVAWDLEQGVVGKRVAAREPVEKSGLVYVFNNLRNLQTFWVVQAALYVGHRHDFCAEVVQQSRGPASHISETLNCKRAFANVATIVFEHFADGEHAAAARRRIAAQGSRVKK